MVIETLSQKIVFPFSEDTMEEGEPSAKRKKKLSGREIIAKLDSNEKDVKKAVAEIIDELCPFDVNDEDALQIEDRVERLERVAKLLEIKVYKLRKGVKEGKFRHKPGVKPGVKSKLGSLYSVFTPFFSISNNIC